MIGWKLVKLGSIAKVISGFAFKSLDFKTVGIPVIKIKNIKNGEVDITECDFVESSFINLNTKYHLNRNDILVSLTGSHLTQPNSVVGRIALYKNKETSLLNQRAGKILPNDDLVVPLFLYSYLSQDSVKESIAVKARGAANQANISPGDVEDTDILLPPIATQRRIASILSAYDDLIENNLKRIKLLEELAQRTYEEWFVKFRVNGEALVIDEQTGLPEGWAWGTFNDLVGMQNGYAFKSGDFTMVGSPVIKIKNIDSNTVDVDNADCVDKVIALGASKFKLNTGDLLIAMTGATVGKVGYVPHSNRSCYLNQRVGRFTVKGSPNIHFVFAAMTIGNGFKQVSNYAGGAAQPNISSAQILSIGTVIPSATLLATFNSFADINVKQTLVLRNQNRLLKESRDILLPRLMNGTISVEQAKESLAMAAEPEVEYNKA